MKRFGKLFDHICSLDNLELADQKARKGKGNRYGICKHDENHMGNLIHLREQLLSKSFKTSAYSVFKVYEPKEREVFRLPYYPDRILHHAIMNFLEPVFTNCFTSDTYSCIKGRGIHSAVTAVRSALRSSKETAFCLKLDITKFYPSVDHEILKKLLRRKFKDPDLHWLLSEIIDSAPGLPIGNYLSQYFANFYLTYFDHWLKEVVGVKHYFRYADDLVILAPTKPELHQLRVLITNYLQSQLRLTVKGNYRVFPVSEGIDFLGYVFFHSHTRLRSSIKKRFAKAVNRNCSAGTLASYRGWAIHCDSINLMKKLLQTI